MDIPNLELLTLDKPVRNMAEVIQTGLFDGGTLDLFYDSKHLRIESATFIVNGLSIRPDVSNGFPTILQRKKDKWGRYRNQHFDLYLNLQAVPIAFHDSDGKLMFITLAHKTREGKPAMFVYYRTGRSPKQDDFQIIDWPEGCQPVSNGKVTRGSHN